MAASDDTCTACACNVCSKIRLNIDQIFRALDTYGWMLDTYVVDFFQDEIWQKLPSAWRTFLDEITPEELGKWILKESESKKVWPLSMLALRRFIQTSEISRDHEKETVLKCSATLDGCDNDKSSSCVNIKNDDENRKIGAKHARFNNLFSKHVKKKKRYEIDVMSKITADCASKAGCDCVVDIGAGMGHLARVLAYKHDLCVACVEQNETLLEGARKWDEQLLASLVKHIPNFRERKPEHVSLQVGATSAARQQLADQLTSIFTNKFDSADGFGLIGLHPCGDLAATLLRFFSTEDTARFICIVGCCYMKMSLGDSEERGYPMSQYLARKKYNYDLTYAALEVACHALEKHCDKLKTKNYNDLIVHAYRAVLEFLLIEKNSELRHTQLKNTKIKEDTTFKEYCDVATECLETKDRPTNLDYERADIKQYLKEWRRVLIFTSLRMFIAPLVETIVLYDRFLYLSELNLSPTIKAEFDSRISPRNFLLVSIKQRTEKNYE